MKSTTYLRIVGDFDPDLVTQMLGILPNKTIKKGTIRPNSAGRLYEFSAWHGGFVDKVNEDDIGKQMVDTIKVFAGKTQELQTIKKTMGVNLFLVVVPEFSALNDSPIISPPREVIEFCYLTGADLDYDYYFYI